MCKCQRDRYKDPATENEKVINLREEVIKRLEQTVGNDQFLRNEPMKKHITFRVGGPAACFLMPSTKEQIEEALSNLKEAMANLELSKPDTEVKNLAPDAKTDGLCNYDGLDGRIDDLGGLASLNNEKEPANSADTSNGVWHNWLGGNQSGDAWVEYDWDKEIVICQSDAYYFTDGNFAPKSVSYQYKDSNGNWQDVKNAKGLGVELDKYNTTTFTPVKTTAIRMIMSPKTLGCGVIEWKV